MPPDVCFLLRECGETAYHVHFLSAETVSQGPARLWVPLPRGSGACPAPSPTPAGENLAAQMKRAVVGASRASTLASLPRRPETAPASSCPSQPRKQGSRDQCITVCLTLTSPVRPAGPGRQHALNEQACHVDRYAVCLVGSPTAKRSTFLVYAEENALPWQWHLPGNLIRVPIPWTWGSYGKPRPPALSVLELGFPCICSILG